MQCLLIVEYLLDFPLLWKHFSQWHVSTIAGHFQSTLWGEDLLCGIYWNHVSEWDLCEERIVGEKSTPQISSFYVMLMKSTLKLDLSKAADWKHVRFPEAEFDLNMTSDQLFEVSRVFFLPHQAFDQNWHIANYLVEEIKHGSRR